jgi:TetR/AcrR family transcriptional repressor of nem operon
MRLPESEEVFMGLTTKDKLLDVAHDLFLNQGFAATSIDEICRRAKVTKGAFFHYFKSKDDLGKAVLNRFCDSAQEVMAKAGCSETNPDPLERVFSNLNCVIDYAKSAGSFKGCLIATFTQELSGTNADIQAICSTSLRTWAKTIKEDLKLAKIKYAPRSRLDVGSLADYCVAVVEGAQVLAKATQSPAVIEKAINHLKQYLNLLFKKPTKPKRETA